MMNNWSADFGNDPYDDYNLIVEILCDNEEIAVIKQGQNGLNLIWYPNEEEISMPVDWLLGLLEETQKRMA